MITSTTRITLLDAVTTGQSQPIMMAAHIAPTFYVIGTGTVSGGTVLIEEADANPETGPGGYSGTWSLVYTVTASDVSGGKQKAIHLTGPNSYGYLRARVSSDITGGGTITVVLRAAE